MIQTTSFLMIVSPFTFRAATWCEAGGVYLPPSRGTCLALGLPESEIRRGSRHLPGRCLNARPAGRGRASHVPPRPVSNPPARRNAGTFLVKETLISKIIRCQEDFFH